MTRTSHTIIRIGTILSLLFPVFAVTSCRPSPEESRQPAMESPDVSATSKFQFRHLDPDHTHTRQLLENAFRYVDPKHGLTDEASGYPLEGWNQDPERGLFLRSFTQLTAIGQWIELLANIAAGQADNPFISREDALNRLEHVVGTLVKDQQDPTLAKHGLLVNFLGLESGTRLGPLTRSVPRQDFLDAFGTERGDAIWNALLEKEWLTPQNNDTEGLIVRSETYGSKHFDGSLEPFSDDSTIEKVMELLDHRTVMVAYGDNANLSTSVAKAIGALLNPPSSNQPPAVQIRAALESFLEAQDAGYRRLIDEEAGMFSFGRDESSGQFFGWNNPDGKWVVGHMDYLINEFREPTTFVVLRFGLTSEVIRNLGFKIRAYETVDGDLLHAPVAYSGSAFQMLGLDIAFPSSLNPVWQTILENTVRMEIDYASRLGLPGFLSESYSGRGTEYTGELGIPEIAVTQQERLTNAGSLYTLGTASQIAPDAMEAFLQANWPIIAALFTDHGPWEGYDIQDHESIEFQTTAHTLSLLLGGMGNGPGNMQRYLETRGLMEQLIEMYRPGPPLDFLSASVRVVPWDAEGRQIIVERPEGKLQVRRDTGSAAGLVFHLPGESGSDLSGGYLELRYQSTVPFDRITLSVRSTRSFSEHAIPIEIHTRFNQTKAEETLLIPLPTGPQLNGIKELHLQFPRSPDPEHVELIFSRVRFEPGEDSP